MSGFRGLWAVVPVKGAGAKRRLGPLLAAHERAAFARAMLQDVLSALARTSSLAGVMVITGDAGVMALARASGALAIADTGNAGMTAAVTVAARRLETMACAGMLVIPADVPLIAPADIETILAAHRVAPSVTLVPASVDGGTNALACSPPGVVPFCFGRDSFRRHREAARARGIEPAVPRLTRIEQDIDRPGDISDLLLRPSATHAHAYLTANGIPERLLRAQPGRRRSDEAAMAGDAASS